MTYYNTSNMTPINCSARVGVAHYLQTKLLMSLALASALALVATSGCCTKAQSRAPAEGARLDGFMLEIVWVGADSGRARYRAAYASVDKQQELVAWYNRMGLLQDYSRIAILNPAEVSRLRGYLNAPERVSLRKPIDTDTLAGEPHYGLSVHDGTEEYRLDIGLDAAAVPVLKYIESLLDPAERFPITRIIHRIENASRVTEPEPNPRSAADAGFALCSYIERPWSRAADSVRYAEGVRR